MADAIDRWVQPVAGPVDARLVVQLDPPDSGGAWRLSVFGPSPDGPLVPVEVALVDGRSKRRLATELERLERLVPALRRPGELRRGKVVLSQDEAWDLMANTGTVLEAAGFDVRVPNLLRRRPTPSLRITAEGSEPSTVGASQLVNVRWSAVFGDIELTAAEIARLATEARPLVESRGSWVELDRVDLVAAAAALAERAAKTQLTGAEMLRHAIGLSDSPLAGGVSIVGSSWASELLERAEQIDGGRVATPEGFVGTLRSYQSEALAWLDFLEAGDLGGCLALDMGLGKTPTLLAHVSAHVSTGTTLVIAPPAVVGNWAAEARRFTPGLRTVIHHGASRASAEELEAEIAGADIVLTTYGTAVRDIDALAQHQWERVIVDEAQAIKNPASETAQQLRRLSARVRVALTGTPIENGLGDLWAILDFTNPGLVGPRAAFVSQLGKEGTDARAGAESALRALNGILVFRRTKLEPDVAAELPEKIDELDHCTMTAEQIGLYQAVLDRLVQKPADERKQGDILAAITALKQICNHPAAYQDDGGEPLAGRSGKLTRLEEIIDAVFAADERVLIFTHFAEWGQKLAVHLTERMGQSIECYHGGLARGVRDRMVADFQKGTGAGALVLSLKAGGTGLNLTAASHVVLYDRWWNPAVEDQARDRRVAHRPDPYRHQPPARVPGHGGRTGGGGRRRQAPHRRPRAAEVEHARRPRARTAAGRVRPAARGVVDRRGLRLDLRRGRGRMSPAARSRRPARGGGGAHANFWRDTGTPPAPVVPAEDPTALLQSLGPAPLDVHLAEYHLATVVSRAAALATALAASADLLGQPED